MSRPSIKGPIKGKEKEKLRELKRIFEETYSTADPMFLCILRNMDIEFNENIPSVGISKTEATSKNKTKIMMNAAFLDKFELYDPQTIGAVFAHELYHHCLGHLDFKKVKENLPIWNIAWDAVINNLLNNDIRWSAGIIGVCDKLYVKGEEKLSLIDIILHPGLLFQYSVGSYKTKIATVGWFHSMREAVLKEDYEEIINMLKSKAVKIPAGLILIGGPGGGQKKDGEGGSGISPILDYQIQRYLSEKREGGKEAGFNEQLAELFEKFKKSNDYRKILDLLKPFMRISETKETSVVPKFVKRRDITSIANGYMPVFYDDLFGKDNKYPDCNIFIDVSGSIIDCACVLLAVVKNLSSYMKLRIFQFSNECHEVSMEDFSKGKIKTTYGTDFNCVAGTIVKNPATAHIILTDGYANIEPGLLKQVKERTVFGVLMGTGISKSVLNNMCKNCIHIEKEMCT